MGNGYVCMFLSLIHVLEVYMAMAVWLSRTCMRLVYVLEVYMAMAVWLSRTCMRLRNMYG